MDYKKIIKSRKAREKILRMLAFVPDEMMIKLQYRIKMGRGLNLKSPQRFTEKLQWYKLNYKNPLMIQCVDKADVRNYVEQCGCGASLIPSYGVYDTPDDIDFSELPEKFVAKDTLGSGGNSVLIVKNKNEENLDRLRNTMKQWVSTPAHIRSGGREWPYYSGKNHRILIEKYMESEENSCGLIEYKFFCFHGKAKFLYVMANRTMGKGAETGIFDLQYQQLPCVRLDEFPLKQTVQCPDNFHDMICMAEKLAQPFPHARIDLYNQNGKILFGEITFFDGSGYMKYDPDEFDFVIGGFFQIRQESKG